MWMKKRLKTTPWLVSFAEGERKKKKKKWCVSVRRKIQIICRVLGEKFEFVVGGYPINNIFCIFILDNTIYGPTNKYFS